MCTLKIWGNDSQFDTHILSHVWSEVKPTSHKGYSGFGKPHLQVPAVKLWVCILPPATGVWTRPERHEILRWKRMPKKTHGCRWCHWYRNIWRNRGSLICWDLLLLGLPCTSTFSRFFLLETELWLNGKYKPLHGLIAKDPLFQD